MSALKEIEILVRSKYPILYIVSWEERRIESTLQSIATDLKRTLNVWTLTQGMKPPIVQSETRSTLSPELEALAQIYQASEGAIFLSKTSIHT